MNSADLDFVLRKNNDNYYSYKSCNNNNKNDKLNQKQIDKQLCLKNSKQYLTLLTEYKHQIKNYLKQFDVDEEVRYNSTNKSSIEKKD